MIQDPGNCHVDRLNLAEALSRLGKHHVQVVVRDQAIRADALALFVSKKHRRGFGWRVLVALSPDEFGLISLYGIVVAPRAGKPWREKPNAGGERRR